MFNAQPTGTVISRRERERVRETDRQTERQTDRERDRATERDRQTERVRESVVQMPTLHTSVFVHAVQSIQFLVYFRLR